MDQEEEKEEEIIEVKIDREVDMVTKKEEVEGKWEEAVVKIGKVVRDKIDNQAMIKNKTSMLMKIKIRMNKIHLKIKIQIKNLKNVDPIIMIMIIFKKEIHIKNSIEEIGKNKVDSVKMGSKKDIAKKHHLTQTQIIGNIMLMTPNSLIL